MESLKLKLINSRPATTDSYVNNPQLYDKSFPLNYSSLRIK